MKKEIWKNYFDIVILPPVEISDYAIQLSKGLEKYGTRWTLGKKSFIPHISLYHIAVKPKDYLAFISEVEKIAKNFSPGILSTTIIKPNLLMFSKPEWIKKLYLRIIKDTVKFYDWDWDTDKTWPSHLLQSGKRFLKKYGTVMIGKNFNPHVTLTSFKGEKPNLKIRKARKFKFKPEALYICELGPSHSCQRVVSEIKFGRK